MSGLEVSIHYAFLPTNARGVGGGGRGGRRGWRIRDEPEYRLPRKLPLAWS